MTPLERMGYLAHAQTAAHRRKIAQARDLIAAHPDFAVSVSWGKDSMVLLHLAATVLPQVQAVNIRYLHWADRLADHDRVRDETLCREDLQGVRYREIDCPGMWQVYERFGVHGLESKEGAAALRWFNQQFNAAFEQADCAGHIVGMRADESTRRKRLIKTRGQYYERADGRKMLLPLAWWSGRDVWAYLVAHDLPAMRIYDFAVQHRDRTRSDIAVGDADSMTLARYGEFQAWQDCYPAEFNAYCDRWPCLRMGC